MAQPRISQLNSWERHTKNVNEAIIKGLRLLRSPYYQDRLQAQIKEDAHPERIEDHLNRILCFCLRVANKELRACGQSPKWEARGQPDPDDIQRPEREKKIPDFQWGYLDLQEENPERGDRIYFIECKRLGEPSSSSHKLNIEYVTNGICRFISVEHGYGQGENSGAMIGYVESMYFADILQEVNDKITSLDEGIPVLSVDGTWEEKDTNYLEHEFERPFPKSPFQLHHFWIDVRDFSF